MNQPRLRSLAVRWSDTWQRCWQSADVDPIVDLYAPDAEFWSEPFREVYRGREGVREYVISAFADESAVRAWFGDPVVGRNRVAVQWWAAMVESKKEVTIVGTSFLRFDARGLVAEQRDTWNICPGRREPTLGWGR